jgi:hypothetical protein
MATLQVAGSAIASPAAGAPGVGSKAPCQDRPFAPIGTWSIALP